MALTQLLAEPQKDAQSGNLGDSGGGWEPVVSLQPQVCWCLLLSPQHSCCLPVQAWSTLALAEPAFIKLLWLEPLKTHRRIFMFNLLGFF